MSTVSKKKIPKWFFLNFVLLLSGWSGLALGAGESNDEIKILLDKMSRAFHELSYDGYFVYVGDGNVQSLRILHTVRGDKEFERLSHLNGAALEVIRNGHELLCVHPGDHLVRLDHTLPSGPSGAFARQFLEVHSRLDQFYNFFKSGSDRVAGRKALRVAVEPVDIYRYGYDLWIDQDSGLLLKSVLYGENKKPLETFEFVQLDIVETLPEALFIPTETTQVHSAHYSLDSTSSPLNPEEKKAMEWSPQWMPPGFYMADQVIKYFPISSQPINTLMYTDGLAAFSVFVEKSSDTSADASVNDIKGANDRAKQAIESSPGPLADNEYQKANANQVRIRQSGGTLAYSRQVEVSDRAYAVTVVGELPVGTLKRIADSVKKIR